MLPCGPDGPDGAEPGDTVRLSAFGASGPRSTRPAWKRVGGGTEAAGWIIVLCARTLSCTAAPTTAAPTTAPATPTVPRSTCGCTTDVWIGRPIRAAMNDGGMPGLAIARTPPCRTN